MVSTRRSYSDRDHTNAIAIAIANANKAVSGSNSNLNSSALMKTSYSQENYFTPGNSSAGSASATSELLSVAANNAKNEVAWFSESQAVPYYVDTEGEDMDDDDEAIIKYEYEAIRSSSVVAGNNSSSSPSGSSAASSAGGVHVIEQTKPLDKSSVRRYCVQVAEHLFQCTLCYKTYTHISNFSRHFLSAHHGLRQEIPCPVCYRIFTRRDNMLTHMKQVHRITVTRGLATSLIQKLSAANEAAGTAEGHVNSN